MKKVAVPGFVFYGFVAMLLLPGQEALATPTPPYLLVNHETRECGERWIGDDCRWCDPLPGWEVVGLASSNQCPEGYAWLDRVEMDCRGYENQFCCSGGSHRGDCPNLVLNGVEKQCTFVEDIESCILPEGWQRRPEGQTPSDWYCPHNHSWLPGPLECLTVSPTADPTVEPQPPAAPTTDDSPTGPPATEVVKEPEVQRNGLAPQLGLLVGLAAFALVLIGILVWLLVRSARR
jgi:hypothetical protein